MKTKTTETTETSIQEQRSSGHGNYGIVNEPCKLHMPEAIIKKLMGDGSSYEEELETALGKDSLVGAEGKKKLTGTAQDKVQALIDKYTGNEKFDKAFNDFFAKRGLVKQRRFVL